MKMYIQLGRLLVLVGVLLGASSAYAAQQFWVSLGSYSKLAGAAELRNRAAGSFSQLSVVPSESAIGMVYRVVDGPVASQAEAQAKLEQARMIGIFDAWVLAKDDSYVMPAGVNDAELMASTSAGSKAVEREAMQSEDSLLATDSLQNSAPGTPLGDYSSVGQNSAYSEPNLSGAEVSADDDYANLPLGKQELVDTAPAGYGLHQLRRAGAMPAGPAVESRLRELEGIGRKQDD